MKIYIKIYTEQLRFVKIGDEVFGCLAIYCGLFEETENGSGIFNRDRMVKNYGIMFERQQLDFV